MEEEEDDDEGEERSRARMTVDGRVAAAAPAHLPAQYDIEIDPVLTSSLPLFPLSTSLTSLCWSHSRLLQGGATWALEI